MSSHDCPRQELINRLADKIEQALRRTIATDPHPCYTRIDSFCYYCLKVKPRTEIRLLVKNPDNLVDDDQICVDCIERNNVEIPDSERSLEFEARTLAIMRIRNEK